MCFCPNKQRSVEPFMCLKTPKTNDSHQYVPHARYCQHFNRSGSLSEWLLACQAKGPVRAVPYFVPFLWNKRVLRVEFHIFAMLPPSFWCSSYSLCVAMFQIWRREVWFKLSTLCSLLQTSNRGRVGIVTFPHPRHVQPNACRGRPVRQHSHGDC